MYIGIKNRFAGSKPIDRTFGSKRVKKIQADMIVQTQRFRYQ
jgi:hypothetical protein